jgi:protease YdgD
MKRLGCIALALSALSCGRANSKIKNTYGQDDRVWVTSHEHPFSALGKLNNGCTGTLIGKKLMLTAAHCVFDPTTQKPRDNFATFEINLVNGRAAAVATPVRAWIGSVQPEQVRSTDWAIVELAEAVGEQQKFMEVSSVDFTQTMPFAVNLAGYSSDINAGLTAGVHWGCRIQQVSEGRLFHDCDSNAGISGAPIFASINGEWRIVGISVSEFRNNQTPPVHRDQWSAEYTNVGVPAQTFFGAVETLRASPDGAQAALSISGAILIDFKSPSVSPQPQQPQPQQPQPQQPQPQQPQPAPQQSPDYLYQVSQLDSPMNLWNKVIRIQGANQLLLNDAALMVTVAAASGIPDFLTAANAVNVRVNQNVHQWNAFVQFGAAGNLYAFDTRALYNSYAALKQNEVYLRQIINRMPYIVIERSRQHGATLLSDLHSFETLVFVP